MGVGLSTGSVLQQLWGRAGCAQRCGMCTALWALWRCAKVLWGRAPSTRWTFSSHSPRIATGLTWLPCSTARRLTQVRSWPGKDQGPGPEIWRRCGDWCCECAQGWNPCMVEILGCYSTTQTVLYAGCRPPLLWVAALGRNNIFSGNQWFRELLWVLLTRCAKSCSHCSSNLGVMDNTRSVKVYPYKGILFQRWDSIQPLCSPPKIVRLQ